MLLIENRVSNVKEKYNIPVDIWEKMVSGSASISSNQKYLEWIAKAYTDSSHQMGGTLDMILDVVERFHRKRNRLPRKDLYSYTSFPALKSVLDNLKGRQRIIDTHEQSKVIYEDDRFKVVVPESHDASCYYGAGTKWCTASKDNAGHFTTYNQSGKLFYILDKTLPTSNPLYKIALNRTYNGGRSFYDAPDQLIANTKPIQYLLDHPLMETIEKYFEFTYKEDIARISAEERQIELERQARDQEWAQQRIVRERRLSVAAELRKENDEWNAENGDYVGTRANALMDHLIEEDYWEDGNDAIETVENEIRDLQNDMENDPEVIENPEGERAQDYGQDLNNLEEEFIEAMANKPTVYNIKYDNSTHYGEMPIFEYDGMEYAVGDDEEADEAAEEQVRNLIDDIGLEGFNENFYGQHVDGEQVAEYVSDWIREDVEESPESYLNEEDDRNLTKEWEEQLEAIDEEIGDLRDQFEDAENESEEEYIDDQIEALEEQMEDIKNEDDNYEWSEEAIDDAMESKLEDIKHDPMEYIQMYELDITDFIDMDDFVEDVISTDGRGNGLAGYDGEEREVNYDGEWFYIYRTN